MKRQIMTPFKAPRKTGGKKKQTEQQTKTKRKTGGKKRQTEQQTILETEEPTEIGLVWPQSAVTDVISEPFNPWLPDETLGGINVDEQIGNGKEVTEESPRLTDYESEGFVARRMERTTPQKFSDGFDLLELARKKQYGITLKQYKDRDRLPLEKDVTIESQEDNVPIVALVKKPRKEKPPKPGWVYAPIVDTTLTSPYWDTLGVESVSVPMQPQHKETSDDEDDNVPIVSIVMQQKLDVLASVSSSAATIVYPEGEAAVGVDVARDFGGDHGICCGKIVRVDMTTRRPLYHCVYDDADEEDYDNAELQYAIDLFVAFKAGGSIQPQWNDDKGSYKFLLCYFFFVRFHICFQIMSKAATARTTQEASTKPMMVRIVRLSVLLLKKCLQSVPKNQ